MLRIKEITINGVKSYLKEASIEFQQGTTVILGPNGAGKSTLLECIKYALFGEFMDHNQKIGDFMNDSNKFEVEMLFHFDRQDYLVKREIKFTGKGQNRPKSNDEITLPNGEIIPNKRDVDLKIRNDILGITSKVMDTATFVRQGSLQDIIGLKGAGLRKEFSEILQLNRFEELKSVWNTMKIRFGREIDRLEEDHEKYMNEVEKIPQLEEKSRNLQIELQTLAQKYEGLEKERLAINAIKMEKDYLQKQNEAFNQEIINKQEVIKQKQVELNEYSTQLHSLDLTEIDKNTLVKLKEKKDRIEKTSLSLTHFYQKSQEFQSPIRLIENQITEEQSKLKLNSKQLQEHKRESENLDLTFSADTEENVLILKNLGNELNAEQLDIVDTFVKFRELREREAEIQTLEAKIGHTHEDFSKFEELELPELVEIKSSDQSAVRKIVDNVFTILDDLRSQYDVEKESIEKIQISLQKLEIEQDQKREIFSELETKGEHECNTCYSIITKEKIDETITRINKDLNLNEGKISDYKNQIGIHQNNISSTKSTLEVYEQFNQIHNVTPLLKLITKQNTLLDDLTKANLSRTQILIQNNLESTSEQELNVRNKEITDKNQMVTKILDTFKQNMKSENEISKLGETLEELQKGLINLYEQNEIESEKTLEQINTEISTLKVELNEINQDIVNSNLILQLRDSLEITKLESGTKIKELDEIKTKLAQGKYREIDQNWKNLTETQDKIRLTQSTRQVEVGSTKVEIGNLKKSEVIAEEINEKIIKTQKMEIVAKEMEHIFAKIHPEILQQKTKNIEYRTNEMLNEFPSDSGIFNIEIDSKFNINIRRRSSGKRLSTHTLSGGEKMSAAFALRVAMSKELADIGFMVLDEPTDGLDQERRKLLAEIIATQKHVKQLFVVTHDDAFNGRTDNTILVKQSNGSSQLLRGALLEKPLTSEETNFDEY